MDQSISAMNDRGSNVWLMGLPATQRPMTCQDDGSPIIRLVGLHKRFDTKVVLDGVDLNLKRGQITVIIGPSGTGKSVLLKHIAGLIKPDRGEVYFEDQRVDTLSQRGLVEVRRQIGFLFQMGALFDSMTVADNVCFPLIEHGIGQWDQLQQKCHRVLEMVGLIDGDPHIAQKMPADLSGGQQKRVALARAIILEPSVVLYDEPTTGLDPPRADLINELIICLARRLCITSVVVTHDMASANKIADRMIMLDKGKVIADADPDAFRQLDDQTLQRFIQGQADKDELQCIRLGLARH